MFLRIWIALFIIFISYSVFLYFNCDAKNQALPGNDVVAGQQVWQKNNCQACHQLYGLGGYMGPDLTNIISQKGENNARTFITYGTGRMPVLHLSDSDVNHLVAFLAWVDKTGSATVPEENVHWTGTYLIK